MKLYDVDGYDAPRMLSEEHAELIGATEHVAVARPTRNASKGDWTDYAIAQGADPIALDAMTRTQIVEQYGS